MEKCRICSNRILDNLFNTHLYICKECLHIQTNKITLDKKKIKSTTIFENFAFCTLLKFLCSNLNKKLIKILNITSDNNLQLDAFKVFSKEYHPTSEIDIIRVSVNKNNKTYTEWSEYTSIKLYEKYGYFDIIIVQDAFEDTDNPINFLNNIYKVMNDDSMLFIETNIIDDVIKSKSSNSHKYLNLYNTNNIHLLCSKNKLFLNDRHTVQTNIGLHDKCYIFEINKIYNPKREIFYKIYDEIVSGIYDEKTYLL